MGNYPGQLRKIAIANGSQNGILNNAACQKAFTMDVVGSRTKFYRVFLLSPLALKTFSSSKVHFTPNYGSTCEIFEANKFLSMPSKRLAKSYNYSTGYDTAPGGTYDTQAQLSEDTEHKTWFGKMYKLGNVKFYSVVPTHTFIPTTSALAYSKPNHNLAENLSIKNIVCTGETPFDAYYAPAESQEHVQLTTAAVDFVKNEIEGNATPLTGGNGTTIRGPDSFCSSDIYEINNLPPGAKIIWEVTGPIDISGPNNESTVTLAKSGSSSGTGTLTATITTPCGPEQVVKQIEVLRAPDYYSLTAWYTTDGYSDYLSDYTNCLKTYTFPGMYSGDIALSDPVATSYNWTLVSKYPILHRP